jgi:hypothetical protein
MDPYKSGGVARRINVVYFLSRGGRTDQPHLFRVNLSHLHRAGVRLRGTSTRRPFVFFFFGRSIRFTNNAAAHCNGAPCSNSDVKRWLSEVRGKDMPDKFSWSYKR